VFESIHSDGEFVFGGIGSLLSVAGRIEIPVVDARKTANPFWDDHKQQSKRCYTISVQKDS